MGKRVLGLVVLCGILLVSSTARARYPVSGEREVIPGVRTFLIKFSKPNVVHVVRIAPTANVSRRVVATPKGSDRLASTSHFCGADCLVAVNGGFFDLETELPIAGQWPEKLATILKPSTLGEAKGLQWILWKGVPQPFKSTPFTMDRHPRTLAFGDAEGTLWFAAVDGRQPGYSLGMTFPEIIRLAQHLGATWAVNLDGGCSTTFVVEGRVKNRPCVDSRTFKGQRPVANAFVIRAMGR
jgi:hypothetical protein